MACVAVNSLMRTIELEFLQPHLRPDLQRYQIIPPNKHLIQSLHGKLGFLIELFDENRMESVEAIKHLERRLRDVAFRAEDEIEIQVVDLYEEDGLGIASLFLENPMGHSLRLRHILLQAIEDIDAIEEELVKVKNEHESFKDLQALDVLQKPDEVITIGDSHSNEMMEREVVSIKDMGGIGKTILARRIYEDPSIDSHFDKRAWVVATQHHNKRQMLTSLLNSLGSNAESCSDDDLALQLYQVLKGLRYLVVIDDIWSIEAWDAVNICFPDDGNGSRVLLTTRLAEVANHTSSNNDFSHQMQLLDQSESWNLFREKACRSRGAEFEAIGRPIVEKCKGLPLAVAVVAGLFSKIDTLDEWKNIAAHALNSFATTALDEECSKVLLLSYNHLPHYLKASFLYLGVFPEDEEIKSSKLAELWSAEGLLVMAFENESLNAVAKRYIQELLDRNLIILSKLSNSGRRVKRFRMHDLLHAFCVRKAQNESLLHVVCDNCSNFPKTGFRWISIQSVDYDTSALLSCSKSCRSFFYFRQKNTTLSFNAFNLLRVVYVNRGGMYKQIVDHVHLRSLTLLFLDNNTTLELTLRAWNIQALDICDYNGDVGGNYSEFPQLRHIYCRFFLGIPPKVVHGLCFLRADYCTKECITNLPYLKEAYITGKSKDWNDCINVLVCLEQLKTLGIYGDGVPTSISNHIVLLKNLKKLSLLSMGYEWKDISVLSKLPMLKMLKLNGYDDYGGNEEWELTEKDKFCQLLFLDISYSSIERWKASSHHFPKLERLVLYSCFRLREIPMGFGEISTLKSIKLRFCLGSAVESAKQIQNEQLEYGNDNMVVIEENTQEHHIWSEEDELV